MLIQSGLKRSIALLVIFVFLAVAVTPNSVVFGATIEEIKEEILVNEASSLISDAVSTESVVSDFESTDESALLVDGNEILVDVSTNPDDDITMSNGLGDDISIGLPENLTKDVEVLTGNDGTVLYKSEDKKPDAELAVQATADEVFEGVRLTMIINNASADHEYDFTLDIPENSKIVTSSEYSGGEIDTGELFVIDANNEISQIIGTPWAKDANGKSVPTRYSLEGNTIKQIVEFNDDTAFPVVADPEIFDDIKCAVTLVLVAAGVGAGAKAVVKLVKNAGSVAKAVKAIYIVVKGKIKKRTKEQITKDLLIAGTVFTGGLSYTELIQDIIGISDIKKNCVMSVY